MNEACKSVFDNGVATVGSEIGYSGEGPVAVYEMIKSSKKTPSAEDIVGDQGTGIQLNIPEGDTVEPPPNGGKGWLIVFAVSVLLSFSSFQTSLQPQTLAFFGKPKPSSESNDGSLTIQETLDQLLENFVTTGDMSLVPNITLILHQLNKTHEIQSIINEKAKEMMTEASAVIDKVTTTQKTIFSIFGVVSSTLILMIGYRWVTLIGSVLLGVGCLGAAFCDNSNLHLVTFLYGALPGIGQNLVTVSCTVVVIEYFKSRRMVALLIPALLAIIMVLVLYALMLFVFQSIGINDWRSYLLLQTAVAGVMVPFSLVLKPLHLRMKDESGGTLVSRIFGVDGLKIYKSPVLYIFASVWYFWEGGFTIVQVKLSTFKGTDLIPFLTLGQLLVILLGFASMIGTCIPCCISKSISLKTIIIIVTIQCTITAFFNFLASQLYNVIYALIFSGILGFLKGLTVPFLQYAIPLVVGEDNLVIGTGMATMGQGLGSLTMTVVAGEIQKRTGSVDECFYLAGALFLVGSCCTVFCYHLLHRNKVKISGNSPNIENT